MQIASKIFHMILYKSKPFVSCPNYQVSLGDTDYIRITENRWSVAHVLEKNKADWSRLWSDATRLIQVPFGFHRRKLMLSLPSQLWTSSNFPQWRQGFLLSHHGEIYFIFERRSKIYDKTTLGWRKKTAPDFDKVMLNTHDARPKLSETAIPRSSS